MMFGCVVVLRLKLPVELAELETSSPNTDRWNQGCSYVAPPQKLMKRPATTSSMSSGSSRVNAEPAAGCTAVMSRS
jgi:hypothetical protein